MQAYARIINERLYCVNHLHENVPLNRLKNQY